jgi:hypothetical protein
MALKKLFPSFRAAVWLQLPPLLAMFILLWVSAWVPFDLSFNTVKFWEYLAYAWVYAAAAYLLGIILIVKYLRAWWLAAAFAFFYLLLYAVNAGFLNQLGSMMSAGFFRTDNLLDGLAFLKGYFTKWIALLTAAAGLSGLLAAWLIRRHAQALAQARPWGLMGLAVLLWALPVLRDMGLFKPTAAVASAAMQSPNPGIWRVDQTFSLRSLSENPLVALAQTLYANRIQPLQTRPADELAALSGVIKKFQLPLGRREYPPLGLKPFDHIIMFGIESLSLDFLAPYNTNLPAELTPFYASPAITGKMLLNYQCVALPTQRGLTATYNSHPNVDALLAAGRFDSSLVKLLNAHGYETYFLMSSPETFLNDNLVFKKMGFQHVLGSQTWMKDPRYAPFINNRGLMDRVLFKIAVDLLDENRDKKIFIDVMSGDTHSPYPRDNYGPLLYPPTPDCVARVTADPQAQAMLTSIFRHDCDLGQAVGEIRERNLLADNTLVILTADHNYPHGEVLNKIPGYPKNYLARIPLAFLSGQPLPSPGDLRRLHTQLDFAPTLVHLLGWPVPDGWWGESVFLPAPVSPVVTISENKVDLKFRDGSAQTVSLDHPGNAMENGLATLVKSIYTNAVPLAAGTPP